MTSPVSAIRDNFEDASVSSSAWVSATGGSATVAETGGQIRFTLPASTAGTHVARLTSRYVVDLTGSDFYINIDTMVATGVAATAFFQLYIDASNALQWVQVSNTIYARSIVAGVSTDHFSATWSASTYKYLRIRHSAGNVLWESSTNGTSWTVRHTMTAPILVSSLYIDFGATCGNVAAPGSFRIEDVNLILPALTTNWRWIQARWALPNRHKTVTLALDTAGTAQGYLLTADDVDVSDNPTGNIRYWSGPAGDGRLLTEQATQAEAQALAVNIPVDGRWDLPEMIEGRVFRLYIRSIDGAAFTMREFFPRRLVQADDIEAESIRTRELAAGAVTADKISVTQLSAITANIGGLVIDTNGYLWQGTGTAASPTTGLKIYNSGGIGALSTYNATVEQIKIDTDGKMKAGGGKVIIDANGITNIATDSLATDGRPGWKVVSAAGQSPYAAMYGIYTDSNNRSITLALLDIPTSNPSAYFWIKRVASTDEFAFVGGNVSMDSDLTVANAVYADRINVDTTGAGIGDVFGSGELNMLGAGTHIVAGDLRIQNSSSTARYLRLYNASGNNECLIRDAGGSGVSSLQVSPGGTTTLVVEANLVRPNTAGTQNLGNATFYWNDISYKTLTDRGCLALVDMWEAADGQRVSATEVLLGLRAHPSNRTIYGETMLDYESVPKHSRKPAPIATEDIYEDDPTDIDEQGNPKKKIKYRTGEKAGEDGVEMTALFSIMIASQRDLARRLDVLEKRNGR